MAVKDWSTTSGDNTSIDGTDISENCAPSGINDALRKIMAATKGAQFTTLSAEKGGDIASASPLVINTDGWYFDVTGTTGFSAMTVAAERIFALQFDGALTMTDGASLDLGGSNITTAAGDRAWFYATAANTVQMLSYFREGGTVDPLPSTGDGSNLTGIITQGTHTIWVPAAAMRPTVSNGCASLTDVETTAGRPDMQVLDFDASSDEHAQFQVAFPKSWNEGTITYQVFWTSTATDTDGVTWALQGVAVSDGDTIDVAYGAAVTVDDANQSTAEDLYVTAVSGAVTIAGTPATADLCYFRIFRDVSDANDTAAEDARLVGVKLFYTVNAGDDS